MVKIVCGKNKISASGHAGYEREGRDIVCAAVSSLLFALAAWLRARGADHELSAADNKYYLQIRKPDTETEAAMEMVVLGLRRIAEQYPKNVNVKEAD